MSLQPVQRRTLMQMSCFGDWHSSDIYIQYFITISKIKVHEYKRKMRHLRCSQVDMHRNILTWPIQLTPWHPACEQIIILAGGVWQDYLQTDWHSCICIGIYIKSVFKVLLCSTSALYQSIVCMECFTDTTYLMMFRM